MSIPFVYYLDDPKTQDHDTSSSTLTKVNQVPAKTAKSYAATHTSLSKAASSQGAP